MIRSNLSCYKLEGSSRFTVTKQVLRKSIFLFFIVMIHCLKQFYSISKYSNNYIFLYDFIFYYLLVEVLYLGFIGIHMIIFLSNPIYWSFFKVFTKLSMISERNNRHKTQNVFFSLKTITKIVFAFFLIFSLKHTHILDRKPITMLMFNSRIFKNVPFFRLNDHNFFCVAGFACVDENSNQGRSYLNNSIDISHCFFSRSMTTSGQGGVIYVDGGSYSMSINYSVFYNCSCSLNGGAIYFNSFNSNLRMICANRCSCGSSSYCHFAYLIAPQENQVEYLSVSYCSQASFGYYPISLKSGRQRVDNTNSSMNSPYRGSGILIDSPSIFSSSLCSFSNNKVTDSTCIYLCSTSGMISMNYANIVHNNSPSWGGILRIEGAGSRKMMYCIFQNNQNYLFCIYAGSLQVSHSFIDHSSSFFFTSIAVSTTNNNSFTKRTTYQMQFFNSFLCYADVPLEEQKSMNSIYRTKTESFPWIYPIVILMISWD